MLALLAHSDCPVPATLPNIHYSAAQISHIYVELKAIMLLPAYNDGEWILKGANVSVYLRRIKSYYVATSVMMASGF
jgi:hypothetical protein